MAEDPLNMVNKGSKHPGTCFDISDVENLGSGRLGTRNELLYRWHSLIIYGFF
jgi:hypothetical protein